MLILMQQTTVMHAQMDIEVMERDNERGCGWKDTVIDNYVHVIS